MNMTSFWAELDARIAKYNLLTHTFYQAWSHGELKRDDLQMYATEYYHHVEAFPDYLETLEQRLPEGKMRSAVTENRLDELGACAQDRRSHSDLWLDFAQGVGATTEAVKVHQPIAEVEGLINKFRQIANDGTPIEALAAFYAYESQVPAIAREKALWLEKLYGADKSTCKYFSVHATADIEHTHVWRDLINDEIAKDPQQASLAFNTAENIAQALWVVLDGIENKRIGSRCVAPMYH